MFLLSSIQDYLIEDSSRTFLDDLQNLLGICLTGNLEDVLDEQSPWLPHDLGKDDGVRDVENILYQYLGSGGPFGPLVSKGGSLVHLLIWLSSFLGIDV